MRPRPPVLVLLRRRIRHAASRLAIAAYYGPRDQASAPENNRFDHWDCVSRSHVSCRELGLNETVDFVGDTVSNNSSDTSADVTDQSNRNDEQDVQDLYRVVVPVMLSACVLSLLFNLIIVFSVRWVRRTLSPTLYLSLSLAVADGYASLVIGLGLVVNSLLPFVYGVDLGPFNVCYILILEAFRLGGVIVAVLHLLALAVNHYIGILRPLHYAATVTRRTAVIAIVAMWLLPVTFFLAYFSLVPNDGFQSYRCEKYNFLLRRPFRFTFSALVFVPLFLMSVMYVHMFLVVRQHQQGLLQLPSTRQLHKNVKAIITTLLILGTYLLGWMPAVMYFILICLDCPVPFNQIPLWVRVPVGIFANSMIVAKSFVDPIIYVVRMPEIKGALKTIGRTMCGMMEDENGDQQLHSRTDINRQTVLLSSRKVRLVNGKKDGYNGKVSNVT